MNKYIDNINIDQSKILEEINELKLELEKEIKSRIDPNHKKRRLILSILSIFLFFIGIVFLIPLIFFEVKEKKRIAAEINEFVKNKNLFETWFAKIFDHEEISDKYKSEFATTDNQISYLINKYKYTPLGSIKVGVDQTYSIMGGKIFNNPFNLVSGIYYSFTQTKYGKADYYEYMPILQVKTNAFKNLDLWVTNSKRFKGYKKNEIKFDNPYFRKKFLVKSNNSLETMMIFSPLIQEKWLSFLSDLPKFQMHLNDGMINILFQGSNSKHFSSTKPFMNISKLFESTLTISKFLKKFDSNILDNLKIFSQILNLVFCISYFQWEDSTGEKKIIKESNSKTLIENIKKNINNSDFVNIIQ